MNLIRRSAALLAGLFALVGVLGYGGHTTGVQQSDTGNQDHRTYSYRKQIVLLNPDRTPFTQVMSRLKEEKVTDVEYKVFMRDHPMRWTRVNNGAGYASGDLSIVVDNAAGIRVGDILLVPRTGERIYVGAVTTSTNTISSLTRGYVGSTAAAIVDNDWVKILFSKEEENGVQATIVTTTTSTITNFCQIFKRTYGMSNTRKAMTFRSDPHSMRQESMIAMGLMKEDMEEAWFWGKKRKETASGEITRYTGGLDEFCSTNRVDLEGGFAFGDIGYLMARFTRFGSKKKLWFAGRDFRQQMDNIGLEFRRIGGEAKKLGFRVNGFQSSHGDAAVIAHWKLENALAGHCFVVDPAHARMAKLRGYKHNRNIQTPGRDGVESEHLCEKGLWLDMEEAHGVIYNATRKTI